MKFILITFLALLSVSGFSQKNSKKPVYNQQIARGLVKMDKAYFHYKSITQNQKQSATINVLNNSKDTMELVFKNIPTYITLESEPIILLPQQEGIIKVSYDASKNIDKKGNIKWGKDYKRIPVYVKGKEGIRNSRTDFITFRTFIDEDFSYLSKKERKNAPIIKFDTISFNFGKIPQGTVIIHDFVFENQGKDDLEIRYAKGC